MAADQPDLTNVLLCETERLRLVALGPGDSLELRELTDDRAITETIDFLPSPFTQSDADALIGNQRAECDRFFGIRDRRNGELVGIIGAHLRDANEIEIGYWIGVNFQGRGYATEAVRELTGLLKHVFPSRQIIAECKAENRASWRVLERVGFISAGVAGRRVGRQLLMIPRNGPLVS